MIAWNYKFRREEQREDQRYAQRKMFEVIHELSCLICEDKGRRKGS
jgi:hypothetical protein